MVLNNESSDLPCSAEVELPDSVVVCLDCDLLQTLPENPVNEEVLTCCRCGSPLHHKESGSLEVPLALMWTVAILFSIANVFPIISLDASGIHRSATIIEAVQTLWQENMQLVSVLVMTTTVLAPGLEILALTTLLTCIHWRFYLPGLHALLHMTAHCRPWSMVEVFVLGVLVSVVKLSHLAHISAGIALWSYAGVILLFAAAGAHLEPKSLWARLPADGH